MTAKVEGIEGLDDVVEVSRIEADPVPLTFGEDFLTLKVYRRYGTLVPPSASRGVQNSFRLRK